MSKFLTQFTLVDISQQFFQGASTALWILETLKGEHKYLTPATLEVPTHV